MTFWGNSITVEPTTTLSMLGEWSKPMFDEAWPILSVILGVTIAIVVISLMWEGIQVLWEKYGMTREERLKKGFGRTLTELKFYRNLTRFQKMEKELKAYQKKYKNFKF